MQGEKNPFGRMLSFRYGIIIGVTMLLVSAGCASKSSMTRGAQNSPEGSGGRLTAARDTGSEVWKARYIEGVGLLNKGNLEEAKTTLMGVVEMRPGRPEVHNALGALYRRLNNLEKAIVEYQVALSLTEQTKGNEDFTQIASHIQNNLGIAYRQRGDLVAAERAYRRAIQLRPDFPDPYYNLGVLYDLYLNRGKDALKYYREYLALHGRDEDVEMWVEDLERARMKTGRR